MHAIEYIIGALLLVFGVILTFIILSQHGKKKGLSGTLSGGASESFFGKNKGRTKDVMLNKLTVVLATVFTSLVLLLYILHTVINKPSSSNESSTPEYSESESVSDTSEVESEADESIEEENSAEEE